MAFLLLRRRRFYTILDTLADRGPHRPMQQAVYQLSIHPEKIYRKKIKINI